MRSLSGGNDSIKGGKSIWASRLFCFPNPIKKIATFVDIGYRYQTRKGLLLRIGLNPSIPIRDEQESVKRWYGVNRSMIVYPYIGVGYAF